MHEIAAHLLSPIADDPSALPSPTSLLQSVNLLVSSPDASPWMLAVGPYYFSRHWTVRLKMFYFLCSIFTYCLCEKYHKPITRQCYIANCVSWVPRLTLLDLKIDWTYKHAPRMKIVHMEGLTLLSEWVGWNLQHDKPHRLILAAPTGVFSVLTAV